MNPLALVGPAVEPVSLAEMRLHLRLDGTDEDDLVAALITSARLTVEAATGLALVSQGWRVTLPLPADGWVTLPLSPLLSVDAVRAVRPGLVTVLGPGQYSVAGDREPARLQVGSDGVGASSVQVDATYGYGPAPGDVPATLRLGIRQLVACWFEGRGDGPNLSAAALPGSVRTLLAPYQTRRLA